MPWINCDHSKHVPFHSSFVISEKTVENDGAKITLTYYKESPFQSVVNLFAKKIFGKMWVDSCLSTKLSLEKLTREFNQTHFSQASTENLVTAFNNLNQDDQKRFFSSVVTAKHVLFTKVADLVVKNLAQQAVTQRPPSPLPTPSLPPPPEIAVATLTALEDVIKKAEGLMANPIHQHKTAIKASLARAKEVLAKYRNKEALNEWERTKLAKGQLAAELTVLLKKSSIKMSEPRPAPQPSDAIVKSYLEIAKNTIEDIEEYLKRPPSLSQEKSSTLRPELISQLQMLREAQQRLESKKPLLEGDRMYWLNKLDTCMTQADELLFISPSKMSGIFKKIEDIYENAFGGTLICTLLPLTELQAIIAQQTESANTDDKKKACGELQELLDKASECVNILSKEAIPSRVSAKADQTPALKNFLTFIYPETLGDLSLREVVFLSALRRTIDPLTEKFLTLDNLVTMARHIYQKHSLEPDPFINEAEEFLNKNPIENLSVNLSVDDLRKYSLKFDKINNEFIKNFRKKLCKVAEDQIKQIIIIQPNILDLNKELQMAKNKINQAENSQGLLEAMETFDKGIANLFLLSQEWEKLNTQIQKDLDIYERWKIPVSLDLQEARLIAQAHIKKAKTYQDVQKAIAALKQEQEYCATLHANISVKEDESIRTFDKTAENFRLNIEKIEAEGDKDRANELKQFLLRITQEAGKNWFQQRSTPLFIEEHSRLIDTLRAKMQDEGFVRKERGSLTKEPLPSPIAATEQPPPSAVASTAETPPIATTTPVSAPPPLSAVAPVKEEPGSRGRALRQVEQIKDNIRERTRNLLANFEEFKAKHSERALSLETQLYKLKKESVHFKNLQKFLDTPSSVLIDKEDLGRANIYKQMTAFEESVNSIKIKA